jgi:hypothetical protein
MLQAITTKYLSPTNTRNTRVKATAAAGSVTVSWDHALDDRQNHAAAASALATKNGWTGDFVAGGMADGSRVFVNVSDDGDGFTV